MLRGTCLVLLLALSWGARAGAAPQDEAAAFAARVRLKSGRLLQGRVGGPVASEEGPLLRVETNLGEILVPRTSVEGVERAPQDPAGVLVFDEVWVVGLKGDVQRKPAGSEAWEPVAWHDARYAEQGGRPATSLVRPGDSLRTGADGQLDLMPTPEIWLRLGPGTEAELPAPGARISLRLQRGSLLQSVLKRAARPPIVIAQPSLVLGVRGTYFRCEVGESERVQVLEGAIAVEGHGEVAAGGSFSRAASGAVESRPLTDAERAEFRVQRPASIRESMVYVPAARIVLRMPTKDPWPASGPFGRPRRVELALEEHLIDRYEVTNGEYATFATATGAPTPKHFVGGQPREGSDQQPVYGLSYAMAEAYARWCGKDLPSDAEWEYAARGPENRLFPWGDDAAITRELPIGALGVDPARALVWEPPSRLADARAATADISWLGVTSMASGPPEWTRDAFRSGPFFSPEGVPEELGRNEGTLRGLSGRSASTTYRQAAPRGALVGGLRLVHSLR